MPSGFAVASLLVTAGALSLAMAAPARADGDAERGKQLAYTCYGCHGIANYKNVYPTYSVPKLEHQNPEYLASALVAYKSGERSHSTMHSQAATMSPQDMQDIAAFLAGKQVLKPDPETKPESKIPAKAEQLCVACHGKDGVGLVGQYPTLAGQHADYIERALHDYKNGARKNPVMAGFVADLSDDDIRELASYYSKQKPSLNTAEHAMWFVQE
jgi:cytochrome c553